MRTFIVQSNAWQLVHHSDLMTQIVLIILFFMAVFCWTVFLYKAILWRAKRKQLLDVYTQMRAANTLDDIVRIAADNPNTVGGYFLSKALAHLKTLLQAEHAVALPDRDWHQFEYEIQHMREEIVFREERFLSTVSAFTSVSPLLGLFGTVWGIMNSFIGISHKQSADIAAVAPGIAQALITTVGGLIVAVPGYLIYAYLTTHLRSLDHTIGHIADRFLAIVHKTLSTHKGPRA